MITYPASTSVTDAVVKLLSSLQITAGLSARITCAGLIDPVNPHALGQLLYVLSVAFGEARLISAAESQWLQDRMVASEAELALRIERAYSRREAFTSYFSRLVGLNPISEEWMAYDLKVQFTPVEGRWLLCCASLTLSGESPTSGLVFSLGQTYSSEASRYTCERIELRSVSTGDMMSFAGVRDTLVRARVPLDFKTQPDALLS